MNRFLAILIAILFLPTSIQAQTSVATKEAFIQKWEENIASLPTTVKFEKTEQDNIYIFETTLFPYKGHVELLGVIINENLDYYDDYELNSDAKIKGVAEVRLIEATNEFFNDRHFSFEIWQNQQFLFFNTDTQKWMTAKEWKNTHNLTADDFPTNSQSCFTSGSFKKILLDILPLIIILFVVVIALRRAVKSQKEQIAKYDVSMERQKEMMDIAKQSLEMQKQQNEFLKQLLEKK